VPAGKKKGQKSAASKKKSTKNKGGAQRKANSKSGQPYAGNDLTAKLFATMEKHKDVCMSDGDLLLASAVGFHTGTSTRCGHFHHVTAVFQLNRD